MTNTPSAFHLFGACVASLACTLLSAAARADIISPVTVQLVAPGGIVGDSTPLDLVQQVSVGSPINDQGSGEISGYMLDLDSISLVGNSIYLNIAAGDQLGVGGPVVTGYLGSGGQDAVYEFDNLDIGAAISGFTASDDDISGSTPGFLGLLSPGSADDFIQLSGSTLTVDLDNLVFAPRGGDLGTGDDYVQVLITLDAAASSPTGPTNPNGVPEPTSLACLAAAGLGLLAARHLWRSSLSSALRRPASD